MTSKWVWRWRNYCSKGFQGIDRSRRPFVDPDSPERQEGDRQPEVQEGDLQPGVQEGDPQQGVQQPGCQTEGALPELYLKKKNRDNK